MFGMGKSKAKRYEQTTVGERATFDDVAGIDEAENELIEIVDFLKNPASTSALAAACRRACCCRRARYRQDAAGAGDCGAGGGPFFASRLRVRRDDRRRRRLPRTRPVQAGPEAAPAIIFIDELDAIGRTRGAGVFGGHEEREQTLNQILTEMDGFDSREGVIVLAPPTAPTCWTWRCCDRGASTGASWCRVPTASAGRDPQGAHQGVPLAPMSPSSASSPRRPVWSAPSWRTWSMRRLCWPRGARAVRAEDFAEAMEKITLGTGPQHLAKPGRSGAYRLPRGGPRAARMLAPATRSTASRSCRAAWRWE